ncbi:hypothetical protein IWZ00DRAFT_497953 [Phyllosticta capitalensis]
MQEMTETVMDTWKKLIEKKLGLIQATLITVAAVQRARILDADFRAKTNQDEEWKDLVEKCKNRNYKLLDFPSEAYPDLLKDVRSVTRNQGPPRATSDPEILEKSMEVIHFPTTHVLVISSVVGFLGLQARWSCGPRLSRNKSSRPGNFSTRSSYILDGRWKIHTIKPIISL